MIGMSDVVVSVDDIINALERNGYKQSRQGWVVYNKDNTVRSACAMGQAAINLGIDWESISDKMPPRIKRYIIYLNDSKKLSCKEIADKVRANYPDDLKRTFMARRKDYKIRENDNGRP